MPTHATVPLPNQPSPSPSDIHYPSLTFGDVKLSPAQLQSRATELARGLVDAGVGDGDVVALMLRNEPAFLLIMLACRLVGAYPCPINWHFKDAETSHILNDSGAKIVFVHEDLIGQAQAAFDAASALRVAVATPAKIVEDHALSPADTSFNAWQAYESFGVGSATTLPTNAVPRAMLAYTSGTTGQPKGVKRLARPSSEQTATALFLHKLGLAMYGVTGDSRCLVSAPLYHSAPCSYAVFASLAGAHIVLDSKFDAKQTLATIERERITHLYLVPTMYRRLLQLPVYERAAHDLSSVQFVTSTGSPCPPDTKLAMIEWWGPVINEAYASSETGYLTFISASEWLQKRGSVGKAALGARLAVIDDDGRPCKPGEVGLIYGRQDSFPDFTYLNNDGARLASAYGELVTVGDMGYLDEDGYLFLSDRKSDMVISGGVNIYPAEIERYLVALAGVADCAVFGIPDQEFGEALAAAVQVIPGAALTQEGVQEFLRDRLAGYKVPRVVTFHEQLPREDSGKIFKRLLRAPYWATANRQI
jgi:long-chain acyl-CoA synthetase